MRKMPLNQIAFGKTDAFNELNTFGQEYFMESFVANPKYHIDDFLSGSRFFVCGKKGTGKSALLKYLECHFLKDESNLVFPIRFKSEIEQVDKDSFEEIASAPDNSTKNEKYDTSSILDQSSYVLVWKTFLINQIITRASAGEYRVFNETSTDYKLIVSLLKCIYGESKTSSVVMPKIKKGSIELTAAFAENLSASLKLELEFDSQKKRINYTKLSKKVYQIFSQLEFVHSPVYVLIDELELSVRNKYEAIAAIYGELKKKRRTVTNVDLMVEINHIISEYVQIEQATDGITLSRQFDISKIDFDLLRREFAKAKKKNLIMKDLQELIRVRLDAMLFNNPDRIKYHERYQEIIEDYNSQQDRANIEKTFDELMDLVQNMDQEERRYVREGFSSDEELSLYDMLFSENLSKQDIQKIKKVAVDLLQKVKSKIAELDHWTDKQETKATIDTLIRDTLWLELPECYDELRISEYRQRIYEYVYTRYKGVA